MFHVPLEDALLCEGICFGYRSVFVTFSQRPPLPPSIICQHELPVSRQVLERSAAFLHSLNTGVTRLSHCSHPQDKASPAQLRLLPFSSIESQVTVPQQGSR